MFKKHILITVLAVIILALLSYWSFIHDPKNVPSSSNVGSRVIEINGQKLTVDIADEPQEQARGLSGREKMAEDQGMLFIFPQPLSPGFWMKEMKFNIDIIWISKDGMIVGIEKNLSPDTYPNTFSPASPIKYVLEVNAGWSDRHNIKSGDIVAF